MKQIDFRRGFFIVNFCDVERGAQYPCAACLSLVSPNHDTLTEALLEAHRVKSVAGE